MLLHDIQHTPSDTKNLESIKVWELEGSVIIMNYIFCSNKYNIYTSMFSKFLSLIWIK